MTVSFVGFCKVDKTIVQVPGDILPKEGRKKETREFGIFIIFIIEYARALYFSFSIAGYNGWL